ncbi:Nitrate reductase [NADH] 1 [Asimina triloba]
MAASVENRQFGLDQALTRFKPSQQHTARLISSSKAVPAFDDSSSDDDDETFWKSYTKSGYEGEHYISDPRDEGTADSWIQRNPSLIRLTGKHLFNCEPPLTRLMRCGFITPVPLHYVCNHGAVPKAIWEDWTVEICGLVRRPLRLTMSQIVTEFPARELPVTLVCAGNRRKEQNMVKQSIGFNWGAGGLSTSVWRGARLRDVLKRCGMMSGAEGALNVCFEGAEDLPGGGGCKYGTSIKKEWAMDPAREIIEVRKGEER